MAYTHTTYAASPKPLPGLGWIFQFALRYWFQLFLLLVGLHLIFQKEISIQVNVQDRMSGDVSEQLRVAPAAVPASMKQEGGAVQFSAVPQLSGRERSVEPAGETRKFSNLTFILQPSLVRHERVQPEIVEEHLEKCRQYVERFAKVAIAERKKYRVPASITLAQGLLATNAGESSLALETNNHFGFACRTDCRDCDCRSFGTGERSGAMRVFGTPWESYREHSLMMQSPRFSDLLALDTGNYKDWAKGLEKAGYSDDPYYAEKLIRLIVALDLYQFDTVS